MGTLNINTQITNAQHVAERASAKASNLKVQADYAQHDAISAQQQADRLHDKYLDAESQVLKANQRVYNLSNQKIIMTSVFNQVGSIIDFKV